MLRQGRLDALLAEIAARSGLPVKLDSNGSCGIEYGDGFEIALTSLDNGEGVLLHAPLQFLSAADPLPQLRRCMELNLHGIATGGATLSLDPESEWIVLWRRMPVEHVDAHGLEKAIVAFAGAADDLRARLGLGSQPTGRAEAPVGLDHDFTIIRP
jgi:hypothetical protein